MRSAATFHNATGSVDVVFDAVGYYARTHQCLPRMSCWRRSFARRSTGGSATGSAKKGAVAIELTLRDDVMVADSGSLVRWYHSGAVRQGPAYYRARTVLAEDTVDFADLAWAVLLAGRPSPASAQALLEHGPIEIGDVPTAPLHDLDDGGRSAVVDGIVRLARPTRLSFLARVKGSPPEAASVGPRSRQPSDLRVAPTTTMAARDQATGDWNSKPRRDHIGSKRGMESGRPQ